MTLVCSCGSLCDESFALLALSGFSPFELVLVWKPQDILNLSFPASDQLIPSHKDYLQLLKDKVEIIAGILLDYKTKLA